MVDEQPKRRKASRILFELLISLALGLLYLWIVAKVFEYFEWM